MFITHCLQLTLQLHTIDLVRTCRTSSFCTVAWQLARFQLTRRIARSLGDSWASCIKFSYKIVQHSLFFFCCRLGGICIICESVTLFQPKTFFYKYLLSAVSRRLVPCHMCCVLRECMCVRVPVCVWVLFCRGRIYETHCYELSSPSCSANESSGALGNVIQQVDDDVHYTARTRRRGRCGAQLLSGTAGAV